MAYAVLLPCLDNPYSLGYTDEMALTVANKLEVLEKLNEELGALDTERSIIVCGGGALLVLDVIDTRLAEPHSRDLQSNLPRSTRPGWA